MMFPAFSDGPSFYYSLLMNMNDWMDFFLLKKNNLLASIIFLFLWHTLTLYLVFRFFSIVSCIFFLRLNREWYLKVITIVLIMSTSCEDIVGLSLRKGIMELLYPNNIDGFISVVKIIFFYSYPFITEPANVYLSRALRLFLREKYLSLFLWYFCLYSRGC